MGANSSPERTPQRVHRVPSLVTKRRVENTADNIKKEKGHTQSVDTYGGVVYGKSQRCRLLYKAESST